MFTILEDILPGLLKSHRSLLFFLLCLPDNHRGPSIREIHRIWHKIAGELELQRNAGAASVPTHRSEKQRGLEEERLGQPRNQRTRLLERRVLR